MDLTTFLTGGLPLILLTAATLTLGVTHLLLWLYRKATLREMSKEVGPSKEIPKPSLKKEKSASHKPPLIIQELQVETSKTSTKAIHVGISRSRWGITLTYTLGGLAYALLFTIPWLVALGEGFNLNQFLWLLSCYMWPLVLIINLITVTSRWESFYVTIGYFGILVVTAFTISRKSTTDNLPIWQFIYLWLLINAPGTVLSLALLHRRIRAIGPLVFIFIIIGITGAFFFFKWTVNSEKISYALIKTSTILGIGANGAVLLILALGFMVLSILGWLLLRWLGQRYQAKQFSDQALTIDSLWLLFGIIESIGLVFEGKAWIFTGLAAFTIYKLITAIGFALLRRRTTENPNAPSLLILRVFSLGRRSKHFFNRISKYWRHLGPIILIAGPDLVTDEIEPHEFLTFMGGRLSRRFVQGEHDLEQRLANLDIKPDPDGLYRVNEFFCHANTWKTTMRRLAKTSDAILMDLRSFSPTNLGCLYEIEQLLKIVNLQKIVFLVDKTTDKDFLEKQLHHSWQSVGTGSPNFRAKSPTVHLFHLENQPTAFTNPLIRTLLNNALES